MYFVNFFARICRLGQQVFQLIYNALFATKAATEEQINTR